MKYMTILLMILTLFLFKACDRNAESNSKPEYPEEVFIENDILKLGINTTKGKGGGREWFTDPGPVV